MLQTVYNYSRTAHPCLSCSTYGTDEHPDCIETCEAMNCYLLSIGEQPHTPPEEIPEEFKARRYNYLNDSFKHPNYTTPAQTAEAVARVHEIQAATNWNDAELTRRCGLSQSYITRLKKGSYRQIHLTTFHKIMGVECGESS